MKTARLIASAVFLFVVLLRSANGQEWVTGKKSSGSQDGQGSISYSRKWGGLLAAGKNDEARKLCTGWINSAEAIKQAEGHKCLANVALCCDRGVLMAQGNDAGGGSLSGTPSPAALEEALKHLNAALKLAPQDISIHQGRLHLLEVSFLFDDMAKALDDTCTVYKGKEGVHPWLAYVDELFQSKQYRAGLLLLDVLDRHFPNSHEVVGNMGALHAVLKEDEQAIQYLLRAIQLAPNDPIDTWNLGREYDFTGQTALADKWYQKALSLETDAQQKRDNQCLYASFVADKLHDHKRGCELQKASCPPKQQSVCSSSAD